MGRHGRQRGARVALGGRRRRHGNLIYAAGEDQSVESLAKALIRAGAVRAMELDINSFWTSFITYGAPGGEEPKNLLPGWNGPRRDTSNPTTATSSPSTCAEPKRRPRGGRIHRLACIACASSARQGARWWSRAAALPGREQAMPVPARHEVLGTPLTAHRSPTGVRTAIFGMGCFWGAERDLLAGRRASTRPPSATPAASRRTRPTRRSAAGAPATPRSCSSRSTPPRRATRRC